MTSQYGHFRQYEIPYSPELSECRARFLAFFDFLAFFFFRRFLSSSEEEVLEELEDELESLIGESSDPENGLSSSLDLSGRTSRANLFGGMVEVCLKFSNFQKKFFL